MILTAEWEGTVGSKVLGHRHLLLAAAQRTGAELLGCALNKGRKDQPSPHRQGSAGSHLLRSFFRSRLDCPPNPFSASARVKTPVRISSRYAWQDLKPMVYLIQVVCFSKRQAAPDQYDMVVRSVYLAAPWSSLSRRAGRVVLCHRLNLCVARPVRGAGSETPMPSLPRPKQVSYREKDISPCRLTNGCWPSVLRGNWGRLSYF